MLSSHKYSYQLFNFLQETTWLQILFLVLAIHKNAVTAGKMLEINVILMTNSRVTFSILIILKIQWIKNVLPRFLQRKSFHSTSNHKVRFKANVWCVSFYDFSCEFVPEWATWTTAGVNGEVGGGSIEFDTWYSPATGTNTPQLPLRCCLGGAEKHPRLALRFMVTLLNLLCEVKTDDILLSCSHGFCKSKECYCGISSWFFPKKIFLSRFFNRSLESV